MPWFPVCDKKPTGVKPRPHSFDSYPSPIAKDGVLSTTTTIRRRTSLPACPPQAEGFTRRGSNDTMTSSICLQGRSTCAWFPNALASLVSEFRNSRVNRRCRQILPLRLRRQRPSLHRNHRLCLKRPAFFCTSAPTRPAIWICRTPRRPIPGSFGLGCRAPHIPVRAFTKWRPTTRAGLLFRLRNYRARPLSRLAGFK